MGRGLSELQQTILKLAYHNRMIENRVGGPGGADLFHYEVLIEYWHLPGEVHRDPDGKRRYTTGHHFSRSFRNYARFNAARAALTRAVRRLADRGLVIWVSGMYAQWAGVNLTADGIAMAQQLMVNT